jgi:hypothetical protein
MGVKRVRRTGRFGMRTILLPPPGTTRRFTHPSTANGAAARSRSGRGLLAYACCERSISQSRSRLANGLHGPLVIDVGQVVKEAVTATEVLGDLRGELLV